MNAAASGTQAPSSSAVKSTFLKKITPSTITKACDIDLLGLPRPVPAQALYDLFGIVNGSKRGQTALGSWLAFTGRFKAVVPTGEVFISGKTHIPVLEDMIYSVLIEAQQLDEKASVEIALRIGIKPAQKGKPSATGYEYDVQRLVERESESDPIARLQAEASRAMAALPAPAAEKEKPTASATHAKR